MAEKKPKEQPVVRMKSVEKALEMREIKESDPNREEKLRNETQHPPLEEMTSEEHEKFKKSGVTVPPENPFPEQTQDEILTQSLGDARAEQMLNGQVERRTTNLPAEVKEILPPQAETIPVPNTNPPPVTEAFIQEYVETSPPQKKDEIPTLSEVADASSKLFPQELEAVRKYILGDSFNVGTVGYILNTVCSIPGGLPYPGTWATPKDFILPEAVYRVITAEGYLEAIWPIVSIVMGSNVGNCVWVASVVVGIGLYDTLKCLPLLTDPEILRMAEQYDSDDS